MIGLITVAGGNLQNVKNVLGHLGLEYLEISDDVIPDDVTTVLLPGVGTFPNVMAKLTQCGLASVLRARAGKDFGLVGLCSGMQVLADKGLENGRTEGLGLIPGTITRLEPEQESAPIRIPHVGWTKVNPVQDWPEVDTYFYFTHSYFFDADHSDDVAAWSEVHGARPYPAIVKRDRILGVQFHPEVSGESGLELMRAIFKTEL